MAEHRYKQNCQDMRLRFVGPMDPNEFVDAFTVAAPEARPTEDDPRGGTKFDEKAFVRSHL